MNILYLVWGMIEQNYKGYENIQLKDAIGIGKIATRTIRMWLHAK